MTRKAARLFACAAVGVNGDEPASAEGCAALTDERHAFEAPNDLEAIESYLAWLILRRDLTEGRTFSLECDLNRTDTGTCADLIQSMAVEQLDEVVRCTPYDGGGCYELGLGNRHIEVEFTTPISGGDPHVVRAELKSLIVLRENPID